MLSVGSARASSSACNARISGASKNPIPLATVYGISALRSARSYSLSSPRERMRTVISSGRTSRVSTVSSHSLCAACWSSRWSSSSVTRVSPSRSSTIRLAIAVASMSAASDSGTEWRSWSALRNRLRESCSTGTGMYSTVGLSPSTPARPGASGCGSTSNASSPPYSKICSNSPFIPASVSGSVRKFVASCDVSSGVPCAAFAARNSARVSSKTVTSPPRNR